MARKRKLAVNADSYSIIDIIKTSLRPQVEKVGGYLGTPSELESLHAPTGYLPTGIFALDTILSEGKGLPYGRFIETFAPESVGKSALAEYLMGRVKIAKGLSHYIDTERTLDPEHVACYGVNDGDYLTPDLPDLESVWDYARGLVRILNDNNKKRAKEQIARNPVNLLILDSLAATPARDELSEKSHADSHVGLQSRANSKGCRTTLRAFSDSSAIFLFINQIRDKIGAFGYGPKTETPGGRALRYAYSIRLKLSKVKTLKKGEAAIGHLIEVQTTKNKHAPPFMKATLVLSYKHGIDRVASNFLWFNEHGYIIPAGKKGFHWKDSDEIFKKSQFREWAKANASLIKEARTEITAALVAAARSGTDSAESADSE